MVTYHCCHGLLLFFCISLLPTCEWVQPLIMITVSTLLSHHNIAINNYFVQNPYRIDCAVSHYLAILFQCNGFISLLPWFLSSFQRKFSELFFQCHTKITLLLIFLSLINKTEEKFGKWSNYNRIIPPWTI